MAEKLEGKLSDDKSKAFHQERVSKQEIKKAQKEVTEELNSKEYEQRVRNQNNEKLSVIEKAYNKAKLNMMAGSKKNDRKEKDLEKEVAKQEKKDSKAKERKEKTIKKIEAEAEKE